jgi:hypothetical protein
MAPSRKGGLRFGRSIRAVSAPKHPFSPASTVASGSSCPVNVAHDLSAFGFTDSGGASGWQPRTVLLQAAVWTSPELRFFVRLEAHFSVPARACVKAPRAEAVKAAPLARPAGLGLDGFEHRAKLVAAGTVRGMDWKERERRSLLASGGGSHAGGFVSQGQLLQGLPGPFNW